jgi:hypothetical protein
VAADAATIARVTRFMLAREGSPALGAAQWRISVMDGEPDSTAAR